MNDKLDPMNASPKFNELITKLAEMRWQFEVLNCENIEFDHPLYDYVIDDHKEKNVRVIYVQLNNLEYIVHEFDETTLAHLHTELDNWWGEDERVQEELPLTLSRFCETFEGDHAWNSMETRIVLRSEHDYRTIFVLKMNEYVELDVLKLLNDDGTFTDLENELIVEACKTIDETSYIFVTRKGA